MTHDNLFHVIKDPVHGTMQFTAAEDRWVKPFIDSPHFQRLRHIKQLGMGDFIFPGAVHTRFNHCIGCCYTASQIAHKIGLAEEERQLVMTACLLHDIGHGPFSHAFEDIFYQKKIRHEAWTPFFLNEFRTPEFFAEYNQHNPHQRLTAEKFLLIEEMIMHKTPKKNVLADIVSSQLDADRLDYLLRDSHFCGVAYGQFDFRWMLHCLAIVASPEGKRLGLTHKGIGGAEHYLMARRLMTRNIYHHHKKLALEFLLIQLLQNLAKYLETYTPFAEIKTTRLGKFLLAANQFNQIIPSAKNGEAIQQQFLHENYSIYKELSDYDVFAVLKILVKITSDHPAAQIAQRLEMRKIPKIIPLTSAKVLLAENLIAQVKQASPTIPDWQLAIVKTPHQAYNAEEDPILVLTEQGQVKPLGSLSLMIHAMSDQLENTAFLCVDVGITENKAVQKIVAEVIQVGE